jgi:secreted PhoX family phosphatase
MLESVTGCGSDDSAGGGSGGGGGTGGAPNLTSNVAEIGPLGDPDANGVRLPSGFSARIVARSAQEPIPGSGYKWHSAPDGGATFATPDGGWIYVSNSETPFVGGVGALRFDAKAQLVDAYAILQGTSLNCSGGKTPWGTWLSCEEAAKGRVFECDPTGKTEAKERPALGVFKHEAAAYEPVNHHVYLTEDEGDGCLYRFVPAKLTKGRADLGAGALEVATVGGDGSVSWSALPDPTYSGATPTRQQVAGATTFDGGEGIVYFEGVVYFSTKGDNRVWAYHVASAKLDVFYDAAKVTDPILKGVDALVVTAGGDILVAEDGDDMQVVAILPDGSSKPLVQIDGHQGSEVTGLAFDPNGTRLYLSSQRGEGGNGGGITYEVSGPFHSPADPA